MVLHLQAQGCTCGKQSARHSEGRRKLCKDTGAEPGGRLPLRELGDYETGDSHQMGKTGIKLSHPQLQGMVA